ncbi:MAG: response regulator [Candidatus Omnitrophota bacterium]
MKRILLVDDEADIREAVKKKLVQENYEVITASEGHEVLNICKTNNPDLVILDVAIPRINGYEICERIKQDSETKNIPVLFVTGKELNPKGIIERCNTLGAYGFIRKPCAITEILAKIKEILG